MMQSTEADPLQFRADIYKALVERLEWFKARYDILRIFAFEPDSEHVYLGDKAKQVCRYCGLDASQVTFANLSYAIPDQIGNDWVHLRPITVMLAPVRLWAHEAHEDQRMCGRPPKL